jgi:hypothetical protein
MDPNQRVANRGDRWRRTAYCLLRLTGALEWPKSIRFIFLGGSAVVSGLVLRVLGRYVFILLTVLLVGHFLLNLGRWLWHLA